MTVEVPFVGEDQPVGVEVGDLWVDTSSDPAVLKHWTGSEWVAVGAPSGTSGRLASVALECSDASGGILWDLMYETTGDQNLLTDLPDGLGLAFFSRGDSSALEATEEGVWAFSVYVDPTEDPTARVQVSLSAPDYSGERLVIVDASDPLPGARSALINAVLAASVGDLFSVNTGTFEATANPYQPVSYANLIIQRLA